MYIERYFTLYMHKDLTSNIRIKIFKYIQFPKYFFKMEYRDSNTFYEKYSDIDFYSPFEIMKNVDRYLIHFLAYCTLKQMIEEKKPNATKKSKKEDHKQKV